MLSQARGHRTSPSCRMPAPTRSWAKYRDRMAAAGKPSRALVLSEYERYYEELLRYNYGEARDRIARRDAPANRYRWKVALECGCTTLALTRGLEHPPTDGTHRALNKEGSQGHASKLVFVVDAGHQAIDVDDQSINLTYAGLLWCAAHDDEAPMQEIVKWIKQTLMTSRSGEPFSGWKVLLSCGHLGGAISDPDWLPEYGHTHDRETEEKMLQAQARGADVSLQMGWHMASGQWMEPRTHDDCWKCKCHRRIVSFEPLGPLTWPGDRVVTTKRAKQERLREAECRADELRSQLARVETEIQGLTGQ